MDAAELRQILADDAEEKGAVAPATTAYVGRQVTLLRHDISRWWHQRNPILRLLYLVGWFSVLIGSAASLGWSWKTIGAVIGIVVVKSRFLLRDLDPRHMQMLHRNYLTRKWAFHKLLHTSQLWLEKPPADRETLAFQKDALELIQLYVRDHRTDLEGKQIFVNLLVRDGDGVCVIARSHTKRHTPTRYTKEECMLAWEALETGQMQVTGDLEQRFPNAKRDRTYNSILVLPVRLDDRVIGAISIDSELKHHFDRYSEELEGYLAPYVQLLAPTLRTQHARRVLEAGDQ
ncbi:MAG: GAF domain-containing protein [Deltaproteobacteria bacterium]|nr:GAF domain-containing protein [Deltaproteobacteria bacterium]